MTGWSSRFSRISLSVLFIITALYPSSNLNSDALLELWDREYHEIKQDIAGASSGYDGIKQSDVLDINVLILPTDHDPLDVVLRRTKAMYQAIDSIQYQRTPDSLFEEVVTIENKADTASAALRIKLFFDVCRLRRLIAFMNPLIDFTSILFVEQKNSAVSDITRQYGGAHAAPGGGLYVLHDAFTAKPHKVDLLEEAEVVSGQLTGDRLENGSFSSPGLSWDGDTVYFAWCEEPGIPWLSGNSKSRFHIFRTDTRGQAITQLTEGYDDNTDPCVLPSGRIAFLSTRNTGFCRGFDEAVPIHTLFSMKRDGSDVIRLSYHLSHEWKPSVDNNGMIAYTRWDNVDRDRFCGMHLWTCYPDGRDPRTPSGNYPHPHTTMRKRPEWVSYTPMVKGGMRDGRRFRPMCYMDVKSIPGSHKYIATAAPIHGPEKGSLIMIDSRNEDDGALSQIKRITPRIPFPEAETAIDRETLDSVCVYGYARALSGKFFLCVYTHFICLLDCFGNREVLYRSPGDLVPVDPIPLRSRQKPPKLAKRTYEGEDAPVPEWKPRISIQNVYHTYPFSFPKSIIEQTRIKWLRVIALYPQTSPTGNTAPVGYEQEAIARKVLGVVPVEKDGSAYFDAPPHTPLSFQVLDSNHMALHSMRSVTCVHKGENLSCVGCHENKWVSVPPLEKTPLAFQGHPTEIEPEINNNWKPFTFTHLVEPVFQNTCIPCHRDSGKALFTMTHQSLRDYAFFFENGENTLTLPDHGGSHTVPGCFGAHASPMGKALVNSHRERLTDEDWNRVMLWLDNNSPGVAPMITEIEPPSMERRQASSYASPFVVSTTGSQLSVVNNTGVPAQLSLYTPDGRSMYRNSIDPGSAPLHLDRTTGNIPTGLFLVIVEGGKHSLIQRMNIVE